jgi:hypothetical protein
VAIAGCRKRRVQIALAAQPIFCRRRHQPRRPPLAKIRPGKPAPAMGVLHRIFEIWIREKDKGPLLFPSKVTMIEV